MKIKFIAMICTVMFVLIGCTNANEEQQGSGKNTNTNEKTEPKTSEMTDNMRFNEESNRPLKGESEPNYPEDSYQKQNESDVNYTNEKTNKINNKLLEHPDIQVAQVAETKDKLYVAVKLNNKYSADIKEEIYSIVQKYVSNKEIVVMTNVKHWDHQKDTNARGLPKGIGEFIEGFFSS